VVQRDACRRYAWAAHLATFLAAGVAGVGALIAPMRTTLPRPVLPWTAAGPLRLVLFALDAPSADGRIKAVAAVNDTV
jgi:hypothetical protein